MPIDYNADGMQDLLLPMPNAGSTPSWVILQATGAAGAGTFQVVHNDRVGRLNLPAGRYTITTLGGRLSCRASSRLFSKFLQDPDGRLGGGWVVLPASGEFVRGTSHYGFRVKPAS